jgi:hypothetical protein
MSPFAGRTLYPSNNNDAMWQIPLFFSRALGKIGAIFHKPTRRKHSMDGIGNYIMKKDYGGGVFRRRIRLVREGDTRQGRVHGALEDCNHGFQVTVEYENGVVTNIKPEFMRIPFTTCDGANKPLQKLVGIATNADVLEMLNRANPLENCTHLQDLTILAISHAGREGEDDVTYDVEVTDADDGVFYGHQTMRVTRNGETVHEWESNQAMLVAPEKLEGKPLFQGFTAWASEEFDGLELEGAFVLQKGNMVAIGRMIDVEGMAGIKAIEETDRLACHTYSPGNNEAAVRLAGTTRDFTDTPEQLLEFK